MYVLEITGKEWRGNNKNITKTNVTEDGEYIARRNISSLC